MITGRTSGSNFSYAGLEPSEILQKVKAGGNDFGFNAKNDKYEHLLETGIIDPLKIRRLALEYAASVAGSL